MTFSSGLPRRLRSFTQIWFSWMMAGIPRCSGSGTVWTRHTRLILHISSLFMASRAFTMSKGRYRSTCWPIRWTGRDRVSSCLHWPICPVAIWWAYMIWGVVGSRVWVPSAMFWSIPSIHSNGYVEQGTRRCSRCTVRRRSSFFQQFWRRVECMSKIWDWNDPACDAS